MAKGFKFGKPKKEQKTSDPGVVVTDIVDTHLDEKEQQIQALMNKNRELTKYFNLAQEYVKEIEALQATNEQLGYELAVKDSQLKGALEMVEKQTSDIIRLTEQTNELEEKLSIEKPIVPKGFKPPLTKERIQEIQAFATSLLGEKVDNYYKTIAQRFGISVGSAYNHCKDIKNPESKKEENSNE